MAADSLLAAHAEVVEASAAPPPPPSAMIRRRVRHGIVVMRGVRAYAITLADYAITRCVISQSEVAIGVCYAFSSSRRRPSPPLPHGSHVTPAHCATATTAIYAAVDSVVRFFLLSSFLRYRPHSRRGFHSLRRRCADYSAYAILIVARSSPARFLSRAAKSRLSTSSACAECAARLDFLCHAVDDSLEERRRDIPRYAPPPARADDVLHDVFPVAFLARFIFLRVRRDSLYFFTE